MGDSNCLNKMFEFELKNIEVLKRMRDEIHVVKNLSISGDTVVMENLCRVLCDILMFIIDVVILL